MKLLRDMVIRSSWLYGLLSVGLLFGAWAVVSRLLPTGHLPGPLPVARSIANILTTGEFLEHMVPTVIRVTGGFACSFLLSLTIGIVMGTSRPAEKLFEPYVLIGLTIPALCWAAISVMLFGLRESAAIFAIVAIVSPMVTVNVVSGMKALDRELLEMAKAFSKGKLTIIWAVALPQLVPYLMASTRFGLGLAWKVVVIAEMMGLSNGIGYKIAFSFGVFSMKDVLAWTFSFTAIMFLIEYGILGRLERRLTRWRPRPTV